VPDAAWVALGLLRHVGGKTLRALLAHFNQDPYAILAADVKTLRDVPGVGTKIAQAIAEIDLVQVKKAIECWVNAEICIVTWRDNEYPRILRPVEDSPPTLFYRGKLAPTVRGIALVGTRQPTRESIKLTQDLAFAFAQRGHVIVSGLALGIDTAAHYGAIAALNGQTLAVLGSGILDNIYPPENIHLAKAVMSRGALVCEVNPQAAVSSAGLVSRNRIITGLCEKVIVIETAVDGGAMHAARFANLQNKSLYVVQNNASGNQLLIEQGAIPIPPQFSSLDIFDI
jgi:DNA processing protein